MRRQCRNLTSGFANLPKKWVGKIKANDTWCLHLAPYGTRLHVHTHLLLTLTCEENIIIIIILASSDLTVHSHYRIIVAAIKKDIFWVEICPVMICQLPSEFRAKMRRWHEISMIDRVSYGQPASVSCVGKVRQKAKGPAHNEVGGKFGPLFARLWRPS